MNDNPPLTAPIDSSRPPPFHEMNTHPKRFERLIVRILDAEPGVVDAELFGVDGAGQYGIDVIAVLEAGGIDVASCKCYPKITAAEVRRWSQDFLDHWEGRWSQKGVNRFILVTAALNATAEALLTQVESEKAKFAALGLGYEHWHPEKLDKQLRRNRGVTLRCLGQAWADELCGRAPAEPVTPTHPRAWSSAPDIAQLNGLQGLLSEQTNYRIEAVLLDFRRGHVARVDALLTELQTEPLWSQLQPRARARVLRLAGSLALRRHDTALAQTLADAADRLFADEPLLSARILLLTEGPAAALETLGSPTSVAGRQLLASLLLEHGSLEEATRLIEVLLVETPDDPETQRLIAYLRLTQNRREEAIEAADRAEQLAPDWLAVIRVAAIVRYASALSPCIRATWLYYPNPVDEDLVRVDDASQTRMQGALERFDRLIERGEDIESDLAWRLACLANLPERASDAEAACNALLQCDPANTDAMAWAFARGYRMDKARAMAALLPLYEEGSASPGQIRCLNWLMLQDSGPVQVIAVLEAHLDRQRGAAAEETRQRLAILRQEAPQTYAEVADEDDWTPPHDLPRRMDAARTSGDWSGVAEILRDALAVEPPHPAALPLGQSLAANDQWALLAGHVERLQRFGTAAAVDLAAHVLANTGPPQAVLEWLEDARSFFPGGRLPPELRRIEIGARVRKGDLPTAVRAAQELAEQTKQSLDRINLVNLSLAAGDSRRAAPLVRQELETGSLAPEAALRLSAAFEHDDPDLAKVLVRHVLAAGVEDPFVTTALSQAFKLGLEDEAASLFPRLEARAEAGAQDVRKLDLEDTVATMRQMAQAQNEAIAQLQAGAIPVHVLTSFANTDLAKVYDLDRPLGVGAPLACIYIRHGGRPLALTPDLRWDDWQVHLDLTAALLADQLELLDALEALKAPILISRRLPDALFALAHDGTTPQPSRIEAMRRVVQARNEGRLHLTDEVEPAEALIVRHERTRSQAGMPGPTVLTLADALFALGDIDQGSHGKLVGTIGSSADDHVGTPPAASGLLWFADNTLETVAAGGLIDAVLRRYRCEMAADDFDAIVAGIAAADRGTRRAQRIGQLRSRIAAGILCNRYQVVDPAPRDPDEPSDARENAVERCVLDLIGAPNRPGGVIWSDDRMVTGYTNANGNLIVGVVEVLNALVAAGRLSAEARRVKLLDLRRGGAMFIPIGQDEILVPLRNSRVEASGLVETPALTTLRRYLSAALKLDDQVRVGAAIQESIRSQPDETPFLLSLRRLAEDVLAEIWRDPDADLATSSARSDWVWRHLRVERFLRPSPDGANESLWAMTVANLLANIGMNRLADGAQTRARWKAQADWIGEAIIDHLMIGAADAALEPVKGMLARFITSGLDDPKWRDDTAANAHFRRWARIRTTLQPEPFRQALIDDGAFSAKVGLQTGRNVHVCGQRFEYERFWAAASRAVRYGSAKLRTVDGKRRRMRPVKGGVRLSGRGKMHFEHAMLSLPGLGPAARDAALDPILAQFDLPPAIEAKLRARMLQATRLSVLVALFAEGQQASIVQRYNAGGEALSAPEGMDLKILHPGPARDMAHHLRMGWEAEGPVDWSAPWSALRARVGAPWAFRRLAGLPVDLASVIAAQPEATVELPELAKIALTPMAVLHVAALARRLGDEAIANEAFAAFVEGAEACGALFAALMRWTESAFHADPAWGELTAHAQLALVWSHADRLLGLLLSFGVDPVKAGSFFAEQPPPRPVGWPLVRSVAYHEDAATPDLFTPETLLYFGAAYFANGDDVAQAVTDDVVARLRAMLAKDETPEMTHVLLRREGTYDALGSLFNGEARGLIDGPAQSQAERLEAAFKALEADVNDQEAWLRLVIYGRRGLSSAQRAKVDAAYAAVNLMEATDQATIRSFGRIIIEVRRWHGGPADDEEMLRRIDAYARCCGRQHGGVFESQDKAAMKRFDEVVELSAAFARAETPELALQRLGRAIAVVIQAWPAATAQMRDFYDLMCRRTPPPSGPELWRTFIDLRSRL